MARALIMSRVLGILFLSQQDMHTTSVHGSSSEFYVASVSFHCDCDCDCDADTSYRSLLTLLEISAWPWKETTSSPLLFHIKASFDPFAAFIPSLC